MAFRDNTKWRACVVTKAEMPWGEEKRFVFQNHAVSICERPNRDFISEEEAHYLCAVLNAPTVEAFILASSDNRSFKIRPPIYGPEFDAESAAHRQLAALSKEAHQGPDRIDEARGAIDTLYLELCAER